MNQRISRDEALKLADKMFTEKEDEILPEYRCLPPEGKKCVQAVVTDCFLIHQNVGVSFLAKLLTAIIRTAEGMREQTATEKMLNDIGGD
jgi:hypothetical protein